MQKGTIIIVAVALVVIGGAIFFYTQSTRQSPSKGSNQDQAEDKFLEDKNGAVRYVEYSKSVYAQGEDKRRVLYFYASWCPTCRPADADFKQNSSRIPEDLLLLRVNYNDPETDRQERDLAKKYGITYQHTFVQVDSEGREIIKWNGGQIEELLANIK